MSGNKHQNWTKLDPPVKIQIKHQRSGQVRELTCDARWGEKVEAWWGAGVGTVAFDLKTGYGTTQEVSNWRLTIESARLFKGEGHLFVEPSRTKEGRPRVYGPPRLPPGQLSLLDLMVSSPVSPQARIEPVFSDQDFRRAAHEQLRGK